MQTTPIANAGEPAAPRSFFPTLSIQPKEPFNAAAILNIRMTSEPRAIKQIA